MTAPLRALSSPLGRAARALAIGAHPDDAEFNCGATLAKWAAQGCEVHVLVLTDGSKGSWVEGEDVEALVALRREEARAAAAVLGAKDVHFLGEVDGELREGPELRGRLARVIRETQPEVVLGHDPWKRYRLHPDHRHAGFVTVDAVVAARDPHFHTDLGVPHHRPSELWLFEADEPDHTEDVSGFLDTKIEALLAHRSQWRSTMGIGDDPETERPRFEEWVRSVPETFRRIRDV